MAWRQRGLRHRIVAGGVAVGATALLLALLAAHPPPAVEAWRRVASVPMTLRPVGVPAPAPSETRESRPADPVPRSPARRRTGAGPGPDRSPAPPRTAPASAESTAVRAPDDPPARPATGEPADRAASAPLKLDPATLRAAAAGSVGAVRRLAERSGQSLPSDATTRADALGSAVARTGKSDCLAPNEHGNLLSVPVIAFEALTGRCN